MLHEIYVKTRTIRQLVTEYKTLFNSVVVDGRFNNQDLIRWQYVELALIERGCNLKNLHTNLWNSTERSKNNVLPNM